MGRLFSLRIGAGFTDGGKHTLHPRNRLENSIGRPCPSRRREGEAPKPVTRMPHRAEPPKLRSVLCPEKGEHPANDPLIGERCSFPRHPVRMSSHAVKRCSAGDATERGGDMWRCAGRVWRHAGTRAHTHRFRPATEFTFGSSYSSAFISFGAISARAGTRNFCATGGSDGPVLAPSKRRTPLPSGREAENPVGTVS